MTDSTARRILVVVAIALAVGRVVEIVADVEEGGLVQADIDEGCLHAGKDSAYPTLHDVADDALVALALDMEFSEFAVLDQRDPGLPELRIDDDLVAHHSACPSVRAVNLLSRSSRFVPPALASPIERGLLCPEGIWRLVITADSASLVK